MKELNCIFIVFGTKIDKDLSNVRSINTTIIPIVGDCIFAFGKSREVIGRMIDYRNVEDYRLDDEGRGGEYVYIYVK